MNIIERHLSGGPTVQHPRRIVIHCMAYQLDYQGERMYAATFLERRGLSAHMLVAPDGTGIRCRKDDEGAWHALGHNDDSLGMEVLVPGVYDYAGLVKRTAENWVSREQFDFIVWQIREWKWAWPIERIDRHCDLDPERRFFDPGDGFPWTRVLQETWG